jgi:membrane associated rhomboid family serine protease
MIPLKDDTPSTAKPYVTISLIAVQLLSDLAVSGAGASVAFGAHIGGFLTGMLLAPMFKRRGVKLFAS